MGWTLLPRHAPFRQTDVERGVISIITKNYYADGLLVGESIGSTRYYLLDDLLGSVRSVTTSTVSTVFSSNYKPFGESYDLTLSLPDTFYYYYTHKPYDSSTGLYYYGARYFNRYYGGDAHLTGQFGTPDTFSSPQEAIQRLSLKQTGNTAENVGQMTVMPGAKIYQGLTAGRAWQIFVH